MGAISRYFRRVTPLGFFSGVITVAFEFTLYEIAMFTVNVSGRVADACVPKIDAIDGAIPLVPVFIYGYVLSYVFWLVAPSAIGLSGRAAVLNFLFGVGCAVTVGFVILVAFPTRMDRAAEGLLEAASRPGFTGWLINLIVSNDGGDVGKNLLPSFHCLLSTSIWLGVSGKREIPFPVRAAVFVCSALICVSTLFIKQHYFADAVAGIALALACHLFACAVDVGGKIERKLPE